MAWATPRRSTRRAPSTRAANVNAAAALAGAALCASALALSDAPAAAQSIEDKMIAINEILVGDWSGTSVALDFNTGQMVEGPYAFTFGLINEEGTDRAFWGGEFNVLGVSEGEGVMFESIWVNSALFQERRIRWEDIIGPDANGNFSMVIAYETPDPEGNLLEGHDELVYEDGLFTLHQQMRPAGSSDPYFVIGHYEVRKVD